MFWVTSKIMFILQMLQLNINFMLENFFFFCQHLRNNILRTKLGSNSVERMKMNYLQYNVTIQRKQCHIFLGNVRQVCA